MNMMKNSFQASLFQELGDEALRIGSFFFFFFILLSNHVDVLGNDVTEKQIQLWKKVGKNIYQKQIIWHEPENEIRHRSKTSHFYSDLDSASTRMLAEGSSKRNRRKIAKKSDANVIQDSVAEIRKGLQNFKRDPTHKALGYFAEYQILYDEWKEDQKHNNDGIKQDNIDNKVKSFDDLQLEPPPPPMTGLGGGNYWKKYTSKDLNMDRYRSKHFYNPQYTLKEERRESRENAFSKLLAPVDSELLKGALLGSSTASALIRNSNGAESQRLSDAFGDIEENLRRELEQRKNQPAYVNVITGLRCIPDDNNSFCIPETTSTSTLEPPSLLELRKHHNKKQKKMEESSEPQDNLLECMSLTAHHRTPSLGGVGRSNTWEWNYNRNDLHTEASENLSEKIQEKQIKNYLDEMLRMSGDFQNDEAIADRAGSVKYKENGKSTTHRAESSASKYFDRSMQNTSRMLLDWNSKNEKGKEKTFIHKKEKTKVDATERPEETLEKVIERKFQRLLSKNPEKENFTDSTREKEPNMSMTKSYHQDFPTELAISEISDAARDFYVSQQDQHKILTFTPEELQYAVPRLPDTHVEHLEHLEKERKKKERKEKVVERLMELSSRNTFADELRKSYNDATYGPSHVRTPPVKVDIEKALKRQSRAMQRRELVKSWLKTTKRERERKEQQQLVIDREKELEQLGVQRMENALLFLERTA